MGASYTLGARLYVTNKCSMTPISQCIFNTELWVTKVLILYERQQGCFILELRMILSSQSTNTTPDQKSLSLCSLKLSSTLHSFWALFFRLSALKQALQCQLARPQDLGLEPASLSSSSYYLVRELALITGCSTLISHR